MASTNNSKRRRTSSSAGEPTIVKRLQEFPQHSHRDTYVLGSANVHFGDRLYFEDRSNATQQELQRLRDSLYFSGMHGRYESLREAADQTYTWILDPYADADTVPTSRRDHAATFLNWFRCGSGIFWVSGKAGSGKSTLMKYLAEHIALNNPEVDQSGLIVLSFFFWIKGGDLQRGRVGCMRSLLWQLLRNSSTADLAMQTCHLHFKGAWTESVLRTTLSIILSDTKHPVFIFFDGLDDSNDHDETVASLSIFESIARVKVCVSSRPEPIFNDAFRFSPRLRLQDLNSADILQVIKSTFLEDTRVQALAAKLSIDQRNTDWKGLSEKIEWKSEGVFLWVHLVIIDLLRGITQKDDLATLSQRLHGLPNDIYALYKDMLKRAHHDYELYKDRIALYLALALHRNFNVIEFCFAVNLGLRKKYLCPSIFGSIANGNANADVGEDIDCETVVAQVHACTAGLLEIRDFYFPYTEPPGGTYPLADRFPSLSYQLDAFRTSGIAFVHRTAIDFVRNTTEGISLTNASSSMADEVKRACFEVGLTLQAVLPGILGQCISENAALSVLACQVCSDDDRYVALKEQGQCVLSSLHLAGLLLPDTSSWVISTYRYWPHRVACPFPSSDHAFMDLVPVLLQAYRFRAAAMWLEDYKCMNDKEYLTQILIILMHKYSDSTPDESEDAQILLKALIENGANLQQKLTTQIGEIFYPLGVMLFPLVPLEPENFLQICQVSSLTNTDVSIKSPPCCFDCHDLWYHHTQKPKFRLWGDFCVATLSNLGRKGKESCFAPPKIRHEDDRVLVVALPRHWAVGGILGFPKLWGVSESDSELLIADTEEMPDLASFIYCAPGIVETEQVRQVPNLGFVNGRLIATVEMICARSPVLTLAAAMERLGKSQETIHKFYASEAERMARDHVWRRKGWKQWYWGSDIPPEVDVDLEGAVPLSTSSVNLFVIRVTHDPQCQIASIVSIFGDSLPSTLSHIHISIYSSVSSQGSYWQNYAAL